MLSQRDLTCIEFKFCRNPQAVCSGESSFDLMWVTGLFMWIETVQLDPSYSELLRGFVDGEIKQESFIDSITDILGGRDKLARRLNFGDAIEALGLKV